MLYSTPRSPAKADARFQRGQIVELFQLEQFAAIAHSRTMREAAEKMHVSQSALSQNLKKLEAELGCPLFERAHNQLSLTAYGKIMLESAERIIDELTHVTSAIAEEQQRQSRQIRIGCYSSVFAYFELPQIASMASDMNLSCTIAPDSQIVRGLARDDFDIIITADEAEHGGITRELLYEEQALLSVPPKSRLKRREQLDLSDLAATQLLLVSDMPGLSEWYVDMASRSGIAPDQVTMVDSDTYLRDMESSPACHFSTTFMQRYVSYATRRVSLPLTGERTQRKTFLAWRSGEEERLRPLTAALFNARDHLFGGSAFLPFLMNGKKASNLEMTL